MRQFDIDRLHARRMLATSEKHLSGIIADRLADDGCFGRIRSKGDEALFGGFSTAEMKARLGVPTGHPLADFLPLITIKAKDLVNELTRMNILKKKQHTEVDITREHEANNRAMREFLTGRGLRPEDLRPAENIEHVERRCRQEQENRAVPV